MDRQVFYFIFGFVLISAIQIAWTDNNHKRQIESGCFHNMCNETIEYPEDEIRKLVEETPGYKDLFGIILKTNPQVSVEDRNGDYEDGDEEKEENMCRTNTYYTAPKTAIDVDGVKHYVVNGNGMEQLIEYETCDEETSWVADGHIPGYTVSCRVQEVIIRLTVYTNASNGDRALQLKSFSIPSGCYCAVKLNFGGDMQ